MNWLEINKELVNLEKVESIRLTDKLLTVTLKDRKVTKEYYDRETAERYFRNLKKEIENISSERMWIV